MAVFMSRLVDGGNNSTITFTIAGTTYKADDGMTWVEWIHSSYNTGSYVYAETLDYVFSSSAQYVYYNNLPVNKSSAIIANAAYTLN